MLSVHHPNVTRRGGAAGRDDDYTYRFGELRDSPTAVRPLTRSSDKLISAPETTADLYDDKVSHLVDQTMRGFNSTVFA